MTRHLAKLLEMIWYLSMGLFLGLTGGLVLAVILTFRGARELDATPGAEPFSHPMFAEYHNHAVAGYIGQDLFMVGGTVALALFGVAFIARVVHAVVAYFNAGPASCGWYPSQVQGLLIIVCAFFLARTAVITNSINSDWPALYDTQSTEEIIHKRRDQFDSDHQQSEQQMRYAWLAGLGAFMITPWCRRLPDTPLQSGDGKEEGNQEKNREAEKA